MDSGVATRRRGRGRHTGLLEVPCEGLDPADRAFGTWPARPPRGVSDGRARVYIRGEVPASGDDIVILGGLTLFGDPPLALPRPAPERDTGWGRPPWYRRRWGVAAAVAGLAILVLAGYLGVPPLLTALGIRPQTGCGSCQLPIPSSAAIGPGTGVAPGPSSPAPRPSRPARTASAPATGPASQAAPPPATGGGTGTGGDGGTPPSTLGVSYTAIPTGGGFTGQVTVGNNGSAAVSGWQLVVALPGDSVSAVQNAEFTDDNDVLFLTPAPYDLSIGPGSSVTISIYASGPNQEPAECSFNGVGCQ